MSGINEDNVAMGMLRTGMLLAALTALFLVIGFCSVASKE